MYRRILVPHDGSAFAEQVLPNAKDIAQRFNAELHLLEAIEPPNPALLAPNEMDAGLGAEITMEALEEANDDAKARGEARLAALAQQLNAEGIKAVWRIVEGDAARSIIEYEKSADIDLVAMASHGRTGLIRTILGSVTDTVLRDGGRPVLVIRVKEPE